MESTQNPSNTSFLMLTPGQTYNVLIKANQPLGNYYMAMSPYMPAKNVHFLRQPSFAYFNYIDPASSSSSLSSSSSSPYVEPILPSVIDSEAAQAFTNQIKSLYPNEHWSPIDVPLKIDKNLFFTIGLNVFNCNSSSPERCQGPNGGIFAASVNNITFRKPSVSLLNAYYNHLKGYYTTHFPDKPTKMYDFVNASPNNLGVNTQSVIGTQVSVLEYGWSVQVIFQDTGTVSLENHPIHLHGFSFYLLGSGLGNFNSSTAILNLFDPPYRNTIGVPVGGWAVIRFRADNPGTFFHADNSYSLLIYNVYLYVLCFCIWTQHTFQEQMRIINCILVCLRTGCSCRSLVHALPSWHSHDMGAFHGFPCE